MDRQRFGTWFQASPGSHLRVLIWLVLLSLLAYIKVLQNGFVWDDQLLITENYSIRQLGLVFAPHAAHAILKYRPGMELSLALDLKAWGLNPAGFHLTNLLLHLLNVGLVYLLVLRMPRARSLAPLAGLFFALLPVHSEAVAVLLGRSDLLGTALVLLGLLAFQRFLKGFTLFRRGLSYLIALLLYGGMCLTKESGIIFPILLALSENWAWVENGRHRAWRAQLLSLIPFLAIGFLYFWFRLIAAPPSGQHAWGGGAWQSLLWMLIVTWKYFVLLVFPAFLSPYYYPALPQGCDYLRSVGGLAVLLGGCMLILRFHRRHSLAAWSVAWIGLALLPVSNIIPIPGAMMNERWLYLPSVGFCVLTAGAAHHLLGRLSAGKRKAFLGVGLLLFGLYAVRIISWNAVWHDDGILTRVMLQQHPDSPLAHNNRGNYFWQAGRVQEAKEEYAQAFRLAPDLPLIQLNLGNVYRSKGNVRRGIAFYRNAVRIDSLLAPGWLALGSAYQAKGDSDSARVSFQQGLSLDPLNPEALNSLGILYLKEKDYGLAEGCFRRALALRPNDPVLKANLFQAVRRRSEQGQ